MYRISRIIVWAVILLALSSCNGSQALKGERTNDPPVPYRYQGLYHELFAKLRDLRTMVQSQRKDEKSDTSFGVELLVANSNRGEILLTDRVFKASILTLGRLKDLGVQSIALSIQYPILTRSYPRSSEYRNFYQRLAREVRRRGFVLIVEIGTAFREPEFSSIRVDYSGLTIARFNDQLREMAEAIIEDLRPDYLTLFTEPDTQAQNTGLEFSVSNFAATIRHAAEGLKHQGVRLGAGAGTWSDIAYFKALALIPELNYLDLHIYPIQRDFVVDRVMRVAKMAQSHHKSISIGEAWLYKVSERELGNISPVKAFARDVYSFWQPLDDMFLEIIVRLSRHVDAEFCSFFWMKYLYGYLDYDASTMNLRPQQLITKIDSVAGRRIVGNTLSGTGNRFKALIAPDQGGP